MKRIFCEKLKINTETALKKQYPNHLDSWKRSSKLHDLFPENLQLDRFGSLLNINEMNFEIANQEFKSKVRHMNGKNLEEILLQQVK